MAIEEAGGELAAALALLARDRGDAKLCRNAQA
jgi:acetyl esterase/lipase